MVSVNSWADGSMYLEHGLIYTDNVLQRSNTLLEPFANPMHIWKELEMVILQNSAIIRVFNEDFYQVLPLVCVILRNCLQRESTDRRTNLMQVHQWLLEPAPKQSGTLRRLALVQQAEQGGVLV